MWFALIVVRMKETINDSMVDRLDEPELVAETLEIPQPRAVGSPLPRGNGVRVQLPPSYEDLENHPPVPPSSATVTEAAAPAARPVQSAGLVPGRAQAPKIFEAPVPTPRHALPGPKTPQTGFQRAVGAVRRALPIVQRLLPLLDGNIAATVSTILTPPQPPAPLPAPRVDLAPVQASITDLKSQQAELRNQLTEQNTALKRVEDHLQLVKDATDRNTLEQQELIDDLKSMGNKVNLVAAVAVGLLVVSLVVNVFLLLHIRRVLP